jgi:hypothetical protein
VPGRLIDVLILHALQSYGRTAEDVLGWVRERLGFQRTGPRVRARIEASIEQLVREGKVSRTEDCLRLACSAL